jgi:putative transposon-encoded protein
MNINGKTKKKLDKDGIEEVILREVKAFGTSGHVVVGKKYIGKKVTIFIKSLEEKK